MILYKTNGIQNLNSQQWKADEACPSPAQSPVHWHTCCIPFLCFCLLLPLCLHAVFTDKMRGDFDTVIHVFNHLYAPKELKHSLFGWDIQEEALKAKQELENNELCGIDDFQKTLSRFLRTTRDHHVKATYHRYEQAFLPCRIMTAGNRCFFSFIDRTRLPIHLFPIEVGDELLQFDGVNAFEALQQLRESEVGLAPSQTNNLLACFRFTNRLASLGNHVPSGDAHLLVHSQTRNQLIEATIPWFYMPELVNDPAILQRAAKMGVSVGADYTLKPALQMHPFLKMEMKYPGSELILKAIAGNRIQGKDLIGSRDSYIPYLGDPEHMLWQSPPTSPVNAYIFEDNRKRRVGYVRIPSYQEGLRFFNALKQIVQRLEKETDLLVIDQINNPGGFLQNLYAITSLFSSYPLQVPKHRIKLDQSKIDEAVQIIGALYDVETDDEARKRLGRHLECYPVDLKMVHQLLSFSEMLIQEWESGQTLTKPVSMDGIDEILPHAECCYTKPILLIVNSLSFSCGDLFPAILQDNKRATLFGSTTAGAGGHLQEFSFPNTNGITTVDFTGSIAVRPDQSLIENYGVTPDIEYELTANDLQNNFQDYRKAILNALNSL